MSVLGAGPTPQPQATLACPSLSFRSMYGPLLFMAQVSCLPKCHLLRENFPLFHNLSPLPVPSSSCYKIICVSLFADWLRPTSLPLDLYRVRTLSCSHLYSQHLDQSWAHGECLGNAPRNPTEEFPQGLPPLKQGETPSELQVFPRSHQARHVTSIFFFCWVLWSSCIPRPRQPAHAS